MNARFPLFVMAIVPFVGATAPLTAQIRGSEAATVSQTIDGTTITIEYSRPRAAGRELFGELVPYGRSWTGANWATTIELNNDIRLNGTDVPAGKYSMWWVPRPEPERWTLLLDRNAKLFHNQKPTPSDEHIQIAAEPTQSDHVELLTWSFPAVTGDAATVQMRWGTTAVAVQVIVQPSKPVTLAEQDRAIYIGAYDLDVIPGTRWPESARFEVYEAGDMLRGRLPFPIHPGDELDFDLIPAGRNRFNPGIYRDGKLFNIEMGATFEFDVFDERAGVVRLRTIQGAAVATGKRIDIP